MNAFVASLRSDVPVTPGRPKRPPPNPTTPNTGRRPLCKPCSTPTRSPLPSLNLLASPSPVPNRQQATDENMQVAVRVRSFLRREEGCALAVRMRQQTTQLCLPTGEKRLFSFDHCLWSHDAGGENPYADQAEVYRTLGSQLVDNALRGFNSTLLAYGQTGSGKTYSMYGAESPDPVTDGLIPRVCQELFSRIATATAEGQCATCKVQASMTEVYLETIYDLLNGREKLAVRGNLETGFYVPGQRKFDVQDYSAVAALLQRGQAQRITACTELNDSSSRAHCLFELTVKQITSERTITSKISLVDLAGSERVKDSRVEGITLTQSCFINKSLLNLGNCMEAIVESAKNPHRQVPFRDSTLTKLLKESLGGNAHTILLVTISPATADAYQTLAALRFADRAKQIKTHAVINADALQDAKQCSRLIQEQYAARLQRLQEEMQLELRQAEIQERELELEREAMRLAEEKALISSERDTTLQLTAAKRKELEDRELQLGQQCRSVADAQAEVLRQREEVDAQATRIMQEQNERKLKKQQEEEEHLLTLERLRRLEEEYEAQQQAMAEQAADWQADQDRLEWMQCELTEADTRALTFQEAAQQVLCMREMYLTRVTDLVASDCSAREQRWLASCADLEQRLAEQQAALKASDAERHALGAQLEAAQESAVAQQRTLVEEHEGHVAELTELFAKQVADLQQTHNAMQQALIEEHSAKFDSLAHAKDTEVAELREHFAGALREEQSRHAMEMEAQSARFTAAAQEAAEASAAELNILREEDSAREAATRQKAEEEREAILQRHRLEIMSLQRTQDAETERLEGELEDQRLALHSTQEKHRMETALLRRQLEDLQSELADETDHHRKQVFSLRQAADVAAQQAHEAHVREVMDLQGELEEAKAAHQREFSQLQHRIGVDREAELHRIRECHRSEITALQQQLSAAAEEAAAQALGALRQQLETIFEDRLQADSLAHQREVAALQADHGHAVATLQAENAAEKAELIRLHKSKLEQLELESEEQLTQQLRKRSKKHTEALTDLQEAMEAQLHDALRRHQAEVQQLREEMAQQEEQWAQKVQQLDRHHQDTLTCQADELEAARLEWECKERTYLQRISNLEGLVKGNRVELSDREEQLQKLGDLFLKCSSVLATNNKAKGDAGSSPSPNRSFLTSPSYSPGYSTLGKPSLATMRLSGLSDISNVAPGAKANKENECPELLCPVLHL
eukprot:GGOE01021158.1.p1 GENE.GGOE01021158.1~~GGOE01021158.1.p1  ORF type:complete len:1229 (+),score=440.03 GGOE01021158.1:40-3687(+)